MNLKEQNEQLYVPEKVRILGTKNFTEKEKFFELELISGRCLSQDPGQFVQVSILGIGEAPISISSPPRSDNKFEICVRAVGDVTCKLHTLNSGDEFFIRGPFGHGFERKILERFKGKHLFFIAGGLGYVPLRSLINKVIEEKDNYQKITILYGCKKPGERLYANELDRISTLGGNIDLKQIVDKGDENWKGEVGLITAPITNINFDPAETIAILVGPPVMYKFVLQKLLLKKMPKENIYMSLERRMKCAVGKCGHCQMEGVYVCQDGPVFCYADIENNEEAL